MTTPGDTLPTRPPPWWPPSLHGAVRSAEKLRAEWQYVVVEEVVGATVELMRWPWPSADRCGRLVWEDDADDQAMTAAVPQRLMRLQLYKPNKLRRRPRAGDTFAIRLKATAGWDEDGPVDDLALVFPEVVYDVSADAREAAKLAYQGSSSAVFDGEPVRDLVEESQQALEKRSRTTRLKVTPVEEVIDDRIIDDEDDLP